MTQTYSVILGSRLPIHNRCPSCREPSERMDAFSRGRVLVSASINLYEKLKEMWTFRQERSNTVWTWGFKFNSTNIYSRRASSGRCFKGLSYSATRAPAPVPLGQLLWQTECKSFHLRWKRRGSVCRNYSFPLLKAEANWAGGQRLYYYMILQFKDRHPKPSLGNHQKEES